MKIRSVPKGNTKHISREMRAEGAPSLVIDGINNFDLPYLPHRPQYRDFLAI